MIDAATIVLGIRNAFQGVQLGKGTSAGQTEVIDRYGDGCTPLQFEAIPLREVTNDWMSIPPGELERVQVAHLDAEGLRYYLPALMLSVLDDYDPCSLRVIGTLHALYPKPELWDYHMERYKQLSAVQKGAIAAFLAGLPSLLTLSAEDQKLVARAVRNYWDQFLSPG